MLIIKVRFISSLCEDCCCAHFDLFLCYVFHIKVVQVWIQYNENPYRMLPCQFICRIKNESVFCRWFHLCVIKNKNVIWFFFYEKSHHITIDFRILLRINRIIDAQRKNFFAVQNDSIKKSGILLLKFIYSKYTWNTLSFTLKSRATCLTLMIGFFLYWDFPILYKYTLKNLSNNCLWIFALVYTEPKVERVLFDRKIVRSEILAIKLQETCKLYTLCHTITKLRCRLRIRMRIFWSDIWNSIYNAYTHYNMVITDYR